MAKKAQSYDESNIKVYKGLEAIRRKPGMYLGEMGDNAIRSCGKELVDNIFDEFQAGRNKTCKVTVTDSGMILVADESCGMPVGLNKELNISTLTALFTQMHAGGKFDNKAFKVSSGCFTGDTKLRLLSGKIVTFKQLYRRWQKNQTPIPMYSYDLEKDQHAYGNITHVQLSKYVKELARVTLDDGSVIESTVDHPYCVNTLDGRVAKVKAANLKAGSSLLSRHLVTDKDGYVYDKSRTRGSEKLIHRDVAAYYSNTVIPPAHHVHHKNENKADNRPKNLKILTPKQHYDYHEEKLDIWLAYVNGPSRKEKSRFMKENNKKSEFIARQQKGKILKACLRIKKDGLEITAETYTTYRLHGSANWSKAIQYFFSQKKLRKLVEALYKEINKRRKVYSKAQKIWDSLDYELCDHASVSLDANTVNLAKKTRKLLLKHGITNPNKYDLDKLTKGAKQWKTYSRLMQWIAWGDFCAFCGGAEFKPHSDLSEASRKARLLEAEHELMTEKYKRQSLRSFALACKGLSNISEENYENLRREKTYLPMWSKVIVILEKDLGITGNGVKDFVRSYNFSVVSVEIIKLKKAVPVYGLTLDPHHVYRIEPGHIVCNTHGVGLKGCTALCEQLDVWTFRDAVWHHQQFSRGKIVTDVKKKSPPAEVQTMLPSPNRKGTIIRWTPDLSIIGKNAKPPFADIRLYLENLSLLNKGFRITYRTIIKGKDKVEEFNNTVGPAAYLDSICTKLKATREGKPLLVETENLDLALSLTDYDEDDGIKGYVTSSLTVDGGKHLDGFWSALTKALNEQANRRHKFQPKDLRYGLVGYINLRVSGPKFSSQTKEKLVGFEVEGETRGQLISDRQLELEKPEQAIHQFIYPLILQQIKKNKDFAKAVLDRATQVAKAREQSKELMKAASKLKVKYKHDPLPDVLYTASRAKPEEKELFIVEGESAGGCVSGDTKVMLIDGSVLTMEELVSSHQQGKVLHGLSWNTETQQQTAGEFDTPRITKYTTDLVDIELSDGTVVRCTPDHPFLLDDGSTYVAAASLQPGQALQTVIDFKRHSSVK